MYKENSIKIHQTTHLTDTAIREPQGKLPAIIVIMKFKQWMFYHHEYHFLTSGSTCPDRKCWYVELCTRPPGRSRNQAQSPLPILIRWQHNTSLKTTTTIFFFYHIYLARVSRLMPKSFGFWASARHATENDWNRKRVVGRIDKVVAIRGGY